MGRTVNPLSFDFRGSNPLLPTLFEYVGCCMISFNIQNSTYNIIISGSSSFGRAIAFQAIGGRFEPGLPLRIQFARCSLQFAVVMAANC
jgi:hypothetical protein